MKYVKPDSVDIPERPTHVPAEFVLDLRKASRERDSLADLRHLTCPYTPPRARGSAQ